MYLRCIQDNLLLNDGNQMLIMAIINFMRITS